MVEEISKQLSIDSVSWLQVLTLTKIYNKKKQAEQGKYLWRKRSPESGVELSSVFREIDRLEDGIEEVMTSGQDPTQLHFPLVKRN